jgi:predicted aspartyl protease
LAATASTFVVPASRAEKVTPAEPMDLISIGPPADVVTFEDRDTRMTIPVSVGANGPYQFLVDTGAERTVISRELADRLDLGAGDEVKVHSMTDARMVNTAVIPQLQVSRNSVAGIEAPALPAANIGAAGMLGVDSLQSQRVVFDFGRKTMALTPSAKRHENWGPDTIVVTGRSLYGRLILVDARLEGEKVVVVVDTGSQITIGNEALRNRLIAKKKLRKTIPIELFSVTGGRMTADYAEIKKIRIGGAEISNMPIGFADVHPFTQLKLTDRPAILLGMDALRLFKRVSVDFARKEVRFLGPEMLGSGTMRFSATRAPRNPVTG